MTGIPKIDAHQLRELAEAASSMRRPGGETIYGVVRDPTSPTPSLGIDVRIGISAVAPPNDILFEISTPEVEDRPTPSKVTIECEGIPHDLTEKYDAVFWSEAAVEKFVLPYYASKSLWEAAAVLDKLSMYWYGEIPPDTDEGEGGDEDGDEDASEAEGSPSPTRFLAEAPFALAHTPDSDYRCLDSDLHLLFREGDRVRASRLSDLPHPCARDGRADRAPRTPAVTAAA